VVEGVACVQRHAAAAELVRIVGERGRAVFRQAVDARIEERDAGIPVLAAEIGTDLEVLRRSRVEGRIGEEGVVAGMHIAIVADDIAKPGARSTREYLETVGELVGDRRVHTRTAIGKALAVPILETMRIV